MFFKDVVQKYNMSRHVTHMGQDPREIILQTFVHGDIWHVCAQQW